MDPSPELLRGGEAGQGVTDPDPARGDGLGAAQAGGARLQVRFELDVADEVELAVGVGIQQEPAFVAVHGLVFWLRLANSA